jgi:hypothetical protein
MMVEHCDSLKQDDCAAGDGLGSTENYDDVDVDMPRVSKDSEKSPVERFVTLQHRSSFTYFHQDPVPFEFREYSYSFD